MNKKVLLLRLNRENMGKIMGLITFAVLLTVGLQNISPIVKAARYVAGLIAPFAIGGGIAFVLNVPMRFFETHLFSSARWNKKPGGKRVLSILLTFATVCGVVVIVVFMVAPQLYHSIAAIGGELARVSVQIPDMLDETAQKLPIFSEELATVKESFLHIDWKALGAQIIDFLRSKNIVGNTVNLATSVASATANIVLGIVFSIYVLLQKETLSRQFRRLFYSFFPERGVDYFLSICNLTASSFQRFLSGQCLEAVILGLMFFISMAVLRLPYALVIATLIGVTALIPIFGACIGCAIGALLILMIQPIKVVWFLVLFVVLQQLEGNIIYPRVVGGSVGLPSIWVLTAVTLGASIGGVLGLLFAIPICSVIYSLLRDIVRERIEKRQIDQEKLQ